MHKVFDDLLPDGLVSRIQSKLTSDQFNWYALDNLSTGENDQKYNFNYVDNYNYIETNGMSSLIYKDDMWFTSYEIYMMARQIIDYVLQEEQIKLRRVLRVKVNFLTNNTDHSFSEMCINFPHIDAYSDHKVLVYYVNDCDGDTILFNEKWQVGDDSKEIALTTEARVQPKAGRILMFDGLQYHTSQNPIKSKFRYIININFAEEI